MSVALETSKLLRIEPDTERGPNPIHALAQTVVGLLVPLLILRILRPIVAPKHGPGRLAFLRPFVVFGLAAFWLLVLFGNASMFAFKGFPPFDNPPKFDAVSFGTVAGAFFRAMMGVLQTQSGVLILDWLFFRSFQNIPDELRPFAGTLKRRIAFERSIYSFIGTLFVIGFSLLPLASLLIALPLVSPNEAVLTDTVRPAKSWGVRFRRRALALIAGLVVLVALFAFAVTFVNALPLPKNGQFAALAKKTLGFSIAEFLRDGPRLEEEPDLKPLLTRYDDIKKALIDANLEPSVRAEKAQELAGVYRDLTNWALASDRTWVVPKNLLNEYRTLSDPKTRDPSAPARLLSLNLEIGEAVVSAARQKTQTGDLLKRRKSLQEAADKPNQLAADRVEANERLARLDEEIAERENSSAKLRIMRSPQLSAWLAEPVWSFLPAIFIEHWQFVLLTMYGTDLLLLMLIGRVPLTYNFRYLWVRRRDTALTALAFTVVVALVVILLAFVNGMYKLNEGTGVPGNVMVMSDGSTDELFSNLAYGVVSNVERVVVTEDEKGTPLPKAVSVARKAFGTDGKLEYLASYEAYLVMNQPIPAKEGEKPRRRFLQVRALKSGPIASAVHNMELYPGGHWFTDDGVHQESRGKYIPCVIGEGAAGTLGPDFGKPRLDTGDTFSLGDKDWIVVGVMKTHGTTYGSEIWTSINNVVVVAAGKGDKYTTLVIRLSENTDVAGRAVAWHLQNRYDQAKLKAYAEPDYYKELTKTNETFLTWIVFLAVVMAVGGVFGVMNTMFASIAARIKEVGVLRILGFKRWQILISFMIESLAIAFAGGFVGCILGYLANGFEASSTLSGGGASKSIALTMVVDYQTIAAGMLFTLVMGRLGGLVPALSAMRMEILESLR